ncbi:MAG: HNH endonuclease [Gammaproteobacteria bacterium]|nr:HNH endonuclease [Gammaproteobacteria bacterium]
MFARDQYLCLYCGDEFSPNQLTRDHIIPQSRSSDDSWSNAATACRHCKTPPARWGFPY